MDVSRFDAVNKEMSLLRGARAKFDGGTAMPNLLSLARVARGDGNTALTSELVRRGSLEMMAAELNAQERRGSASASRRRSLANEAERDAMVYAASMGLPTPKRAGAGAGAGAGASSALRRSSVAPAPLELEEEGGGRASTTLPSADSLRAVKEDEDEEEDDDDFLLQINWTHMRLAAEERAAFTAKFETLELIKNVTKEWREATREFEWALATRQATSLIPTHWTLRNEARDALRVSYPAPWTEKPPGVDFAPAFPGFDIEPGSEVCLPFGPFGAGRGCFTRFDPGRPARRPEILVEVPPEGLVEASSASSSASPLLLPAHRDGAFVVPAHPEAPAGADLVCHVETTAAAAGEEEAYHRAVALRSAVSVRNGTGVEWEVKIEAPESSSQAAAGLYVESSSSGPARPARGQGSLSFRLAPGARDSVPVRLCARAHLRFRPASEAGAAWPAAPHVDLATRSSDPAAPLRWDPAALVAGSSSFVLEAVPLSDYWSLPARRPRLAPVEIVIRAPLALENLLPVLVFYRISYPPYPPLEGAADPGDCFHCLYPPPPPGDGEGAGPTLSLALEAPPGDEEARAPTPNITPRLRGIPGPANIEELALASAGRRLGSAGRTIREAGPAGPAFFKTVPQPLARAEHIVPSQHGSRLRWSAPVPLHPARLPASGARLGIPDPGSNPGPDHPVLLIPQDRTRERPSDALAPVPPPPPPRTACPAPLHLLLAAPLWVVNDTGLPLRVRPAGAGPEAEAAVPPVAETPARVLAPPSNSLHLFVGAARSVKPIDVSKKVAAAAVEVTDGTVVYEVSHLNQRIGYSVAPGNGPLAGRTRVLTLAPRIVLVNHVHDRKAEPAAPTAVEVVQLRATAHALSVRVHVYAKGPTLQVHLTEETRDFSSARIENACRDHENACRDHEITVSQLGSLQAPQLLRPYGAAASATAWYTAFGWDEPLAPERRIRVDIDDEGSRHTVEVELEREGRTAVPLDGGGAVVLAVRLDRKQGPGPGGDLDACA
eukprot:tig00020710_g13343.t1